MAAIVLPSGFATTNCCRSMYWDPTKRREIPKQKRLDAFRNTTAATSHFEPSRLYPINITSKGRVLLDVPTEHNELDTSASAKKRGMANERRKPSPLRKRAAAAEKAAEKPNWPDEEFLWQLRTEERVDHAKAEEEERLKVIEKFLDCDTNDDDGGGSIGGGTHDDRGDDNVLPSSVWGVVFEDDDAGRGKMVPLRGDPDQERAAKDQWFCFRYEPDNDSSATVDVSVPDVEATFAPTDKAPRRRQADSPFFQPPAPESPTQSSGLSSIPQIPKTPTRVPSIAPNSALASALPLRIYIPPSPGMAH
ncbi:hypothetical protein BDP27DRAFT_1434071 [Rhodocollybia butyracea]|uniref:Uncharacterized protein n=1 Tax=Rhodocollybia butyracea TaxID=206335 RepID=A0A9P5P6J2_9AGAR|nr:hypothetical protein BDP27DRAFT_1434071 [Rhodocollybia butyracea]